MRSKSNDSLLATELHHANVPLLLHEIHHALQRWLETGQPSTIDLLSLPLSTQERDQIFDLLGRGEVDVRLAALGASEIYETHYMGVWVVEHRNTSSEVTGRYIEIADVPEILKSQPQDVQDALERLSNYLALADEAAWGQRC